MFFGFGATAFKSSAAPPVEKQYLMKYSIWSNQSVHCAFDSIVCISLIVLAESRIKVDVDFRGVSKMATNIFRLALYTTVRQVVKSRIRLPLIKVMNSLGLILLD